MATSNYDVHVQLMLATTAESEGNLELAREFLWEAMRLAPDRSTRTGVLSELASFLGRHARASRNDRVLAFAAAV